MNKISYYLNDIRQDLNIDSNAIEPSSFEESDICQTIKIINYNKNYIIEITPSLNNFEVIKFNDNKTKYKTVYECAMDDDDLENVIQLLNKLLKKEMHKYIKSNIK